MRTRANHLLSHAPLLAPIAALILLSRSPYPIEDLLAVALGLILISVVVRSPLSATLALVAYLPFEATVLATLYANGVSAGVLRSLAGVNDAVLIGLVVVVARTIRRTDASLDRTDGLVLAFVVGSLGYVALGDVVTLDAAAGLSARFDSFRTVSAFAMLFLVGRHLPMPASWWDKLSGVLIVVGVALSGFALWQLYSPSGFESFIVDEVRRPKYDLDVLGHSREQLTETYRWFRADPTRSGGLHIAANASSTYLLIPFGFALSRATGNRSGILDWLSLTTITAGMVTSQTRSTLLATAVVVLIASRTRTPGPTRRSRHGIRVGMLAALVAVVALLGPTVLTDRVVGGADAEFSTQGHTDELSQALTTVGRHPLGVGIGSPRLAGSHTGARPLKVHDFLLGILTQLGVVVGGCLLLAAASITRRLVRAAPSPPEEAADYVGGAALAWTGAGIGLLFHPLLVIDIPWTLFFIAGTAWQLLDARAAAGNESGPGDASQLRLGSTTRSFARSPNTHDGI